MKKFGLSLLILFVIVGCANQRREINVSMYRSEIVQSLNAQSQYATAWVSGGYADYTFWSLVDSYSSTLYYSESSEYFGPVASVLSLSDISWLDPSYSLYSIFDITDVKIYLLFDSASAPSVAALLVSYFPAGASAPIFRFLMSQGSPSTDGGKLVTDMISDDGMMIRLESRDLKGNTLKDVVQFQIYSSDGQSMIGKFSTLVKVD